MAKIIPILSTFVPITVGTLTATTAPLIFPSTGMYSYVGVTRTFAGVTSTFNVNASALVLSGSNYTWTDTVAFTSSPSAYHVLTPFILGTLGLSQALTATIPAPTAITGVLAYNAGIGMFDVSWVGGVGIGVTYLYDVSSSGAIVTSGNYTTTVLTASSTRITLTNTAQKTYTVVVKATNGVGTVSSTVSSAITTLSLTTVTFAGYNAKTASGGYSIFVYTASKTTAITSTGTITFNVLPVGGGGSGGCDCHDIRIRNQC